MDGWVTIGTKLETKNFDKEIARTEKKLAELEKSYEEMYAKAQAKAEQEGLLVNEDAFTDIRAEIEKTKNKLIDLRRKQEDLKKSNPFEGVGSSLKDATKKIAKWSLAIFGVRAMYGFVRKLTSNYLSQNEQLTQKIEGMWTGLSQIIGPIIEKIISFIHKLVTAVLYFASVLTGTNYIQKANAQILKNQKKQTDALTKSNNKLTASFDEMNVLSDNSSGGAGSSVANAELFDISDLGEGIKSTIEKIAKKLKPVYKFIKKIIDWAKEHPDAVITILGGLALVSLLKKIIGGSGTGLLGLTGLLEELLAIGVIYITIKVAYETIKTMSYLEETSDLVSEVIDKGDALEEVLENNAKSAERGSKEVKELSDYNLKLIKSSMGVAESSGKTAESIKGFLAIVDGGKAIINGTTSEASKYRDEMERGIISAMQAYSSQFKLYNQGKLTKEQTRELKDISKQYYEQLGNLIMVYDELGLDTVYLKRMQAETKKVMDQLNNSTEIQNKDLQDLAKTIDTQTKKKLKELGISIDENGTVKVKDLSKAIKNLPEIKKIMLNVDANDSGAKSVINNLISNVEKTLNKLPGMKLMKIKLPRLARGGIVNNPGPGVMMGSYVAGEKGPEAVLPLDDATMNRLGEAIARHMTINANITNNMNGRVISRELQKINAENTFAFNS